MIHEKATVAIALIWSRLPRRRPARPLTSFKPTAYKQAQLGEQTVKRANLELANYLPYLINRVGVALVARFERDGLERTHLTIGTWRVLAATANHDGVRQVDLARLTSTEASRGSRRVTGPAQLGRRRPRRSR